MIRIENKRFVAFGLALLALAGVLLAGGIGVAPAAADHQEDGVIDDLLTNDEEDNDSLVNVPDRETTAAAISGLTDRVSYQVSTAFSGPETEAEQAAQDLQDEYNNNSAVYEDWANDHAPVNEDHDVLQIDVELDDETETVYLVADVVENDDGDLQYANSEIVSELPDDRDVDETVTLEGMAAENVGDELSDLRESHISEGEELSSDDPELVRLGAKYGGDVSTSIATGGEL